MASHGVLDGSDIGPELEVKGQGGDWLGCWWSYCSILSYDVPHNAIRWLESEQVIAVTALTCSICSLTDQQMNLKVANTHPCVQSRQHACQWYYLQMTVCRLTSPSG